MLSKNMGFKREKLFKIMGLILIILAILGCIPAFFASGGCPACGYIFVLYLYLIGIPLLLGGLTLISWGKYTALPKKRSKIIGIIFITVFLIWIFRVIGYFSFEYYLDHYLPKKTEGVTAQVLKSKNVEECYKNIRVPIYFSLFSKFFFIKYFEYRVAPLQAKCITTIAIAEQNETICDSLPENGYPQTLDKAQCYIGVAIEKKDLNVCHRMYEMKKEYTEDCYWRVIKILKNLEGKGMNVIDKAVRDFAIKKRDFRICSGAGTEKLTCEREIKILTEEILAPCKNLNTFQDKDECVKDIAIETDNLELCKLLEPFGFGKTPLTHECYTRIALKRDNPEICKYIKAEKAQETCYEQFRLKNE